MSNGLPVTGPGARAGWIPPSPLTAEQEAAEREVYGRLIAHASACRAERCPECSSLCRELRAVGRGSHDRR
jgi:hypothetical protein